MAVQNIGNAFGSKKKKNRYKSKRLKAVAIRQKRQFND
jgi:hypothetical protein